MGLKQVIWTLQYYSTISVAAKIEFQILIQRQI